VCSFQGYYRVPVTDLVSWRVYYFSPVNFTCSFSCQANSDHTQQVVEVSPVVFLDMYAEFDKCHVHFRDVELKCLVENLNCCVVVDGRFPFGIALTTVH
jgi:hypothetical protein